MSPKPAKRLISLVGSTANNLASHYLWEKEVLIDYIATRIRLIEEPLLEAVKDRGMTNEVHYVELTKLARALIKQSSAGLNAKIDLAGVFGDIRDFVAWDKQEVADYLVRRVIELQLSAVMIRDGKLDHTSEEIHELAY